MNEKDAANVLETLVDLATEDERKGLPSASNWRRYELCAGSYQLGEEARRLGQEAHSAPSKASAAGDRKHASLAGQAIELKEGEAHTVELLRERAGDQVKRIFGDSPYKELIEKRLWLKVDGRDVLSGKPDRVVYSENVALVQDYKTGWAEPDPAEINSQLKVLAVLAAQPIHITEVVVQLISGTIEPSEARYGLEELSSAYRDIMATLRAINDPGAALSPSIEACRYCPAINVCPAVRDLAPRVPERAESLPGGQGARELLDGIEILQKRIDAIRAYYYEQLVNDPEYVPGWGLVPGAPRRTVTDWVAARTKLEEFVDAKELDNLACYSIPEAEKLLGAAIGVKGLKLKVQFATVLGDLLELKYPEPALRRINGKTKVDALIG